MEAEREGERVQVGIKKKHFLTLSLAHFFNMKQAPKMCCLNFDAHTHAQRNT